MEQSWFEMAEIRRRKFANAVWIPLRAIHSVQELGARGHSGFKEEFFGAGSLAVPVDQKDEALNLEWMDVGISREHGACVDSGRYIPSDIYEVTRGQPLGLALVLEQRLNRNEPPVWHLHQDIVLALHLMREGDRWVCPDEDYVEVAKLSRHSDGRPYLLVMRAEFLFDYLCARKMGLYITSYRNREEVVEDASHIKWTNDPESDKREGERWEGRVIAIHEGGMPFGAETAVFHVSRTDVDPEEDVPTFGFPTDDATASKSWSFKRGERKLFVVQGEYWRDEWINPGKYSPRIRGDSVPGSVFFITDAAGTRESKDTLDKESRWLWFRPEVITALVDRRGGNLGWHTRDTGSVSCSPDYSVHFGVNSLGLINVYAKDVGLLPDWQQRIWSGFNVSPEGGVSEELLASQMRADPANTEASESRFVAALSAMDESFRTATGKPLLREHPYRPEVLGRIHRFRATDQKGLFALAKDIARLTADSIDVATLHEIVTPPKSEKWGSLKSLEKVLALICPAEQARSTLTQLVGVYELRLADAHLPSSEIVQAMKMAGIDESSPPMQQGLALIKNCVDGIEIITKMLHGLAPKATAEGG